MQFQAADLDRIAQATGIDTVHYLEEIPSTNDAALRAAARGKGEQIELFLAERQSAGRGRGDNQWWSGPGALTFSVLTRPLEIEIARTPLLALTVGAALRDAVRDFAPDAEVALKWPNDVYLNGKKLAGVLIESAAVRSVRYVIGVGLNVNNRIAEAPPEVQSVATSLLDALPERGDHPIPRTDVLLRCLRAIQAGVDRLLLAEQAGHFTELANWWRQDALLTGRWVRVETANGVVKGVCETIGDDGALIVATAEGALSCYSGAVIDFR